MFDIDRIGIVRIIVSQMRTDNGSSKETVNIKKYRNRRLFNSNDKKYLTLDDISRLIKEGRKIKVIETSNNNDITKQVLIQIILEHEKNYEEILPISFLFKLIKYSDHISRLELEDSFLGIVQTYIDKKNSLINNGNNADKKNNGTTDQLNVPSSVSDELLDLRNRMQELENKISEFDSP